MILYKSMSYNIVKEIYPDIDINIHNEYIIIKVNENNVGLFELQPLTKISYVLHSYIRPEFRDKSYSTRATKALVKFLKERTQIKKLIGAIPVLIAKQLNIANQINAKACGLIHKGVIYDGIVQDLLLFELDIHEV